MKILSKFREVIMDKDKISKALPLWWHQDHQKWIEEVGQWQHESDRLVALLSQLEYALPEHTATLNKHVENIQQHEAYLLRYESGMVEFDSRKKQQKYHLDWTQSHEKMNQDHRDLKKSYAEEMEKFKSLLTKLLNECA